MKYNELKAYFKHLEKGDSDHFLSFFTLQLSGSVRVLDSSQVRQPQLNGDRSKLLNF